MFSMWHWDNHLPSQCFCFPICKAEIMPTSKADPLAGRCHLRAESSVIPSANVIIISSGQDSLFCSSGCPQWMQAPVMDLVWGLYHLMHVLLWWTVASLFSTTGQHCLLLGLHEDKMGFVHMFFPPALFKRDRGFFDVLVVPCLC